MLRSKYRIDSASGSEQWKTMKKIRTKSREFPLYSIVIPIYHIRQNLLFYS